MEIYTKLAAQDSISRGSKYDNQYKKSFVIVILQSCDLLEEYR